MNNPVLAFGEWLADASRRWPAQAREAAHRSFIDTLAVTVRGAGEEAPRRACRAVVGWGEGPCTAIGTGRPLAAPWAALVNGTAAHVLDFDDNFDPGKAHASAVLVPAILAIAEQEGLGGSDCLDAYIAGLQITGRVGEGLNPIHRTRGWHATSTVGAIGAAAACARLLRLDGREAAYALSIATSMAGGFMSQFGTMMKPLHAGLAAKAGVLAAAFARSGIDAGLGTIDSRTGMNGLMIGPDHDQQRERLKLRFETADVADPLFILSPGLRVKRFPNCASAHRSMEALLEVRASHDFAASDVERLTVRAPLRQFNNLMFTAPENVLEAKFSMEFALAVLLLEGDLRLDHFRPDFVTNADLRDLYPRIVREPVDEEPGRTRGEVEVALKDGRRLSACVFEPTGSPSAPFRWEDYWRKFDTCVAGQLSHEAAAELRDALERLPKLESIGPLMDPLRALSR